MATGSTPRAGAFERFGDVWFALGGLLVLFGLGCTVAAFNWLAITQGFAGSDPAEPESTALAIGALAGAARWGLVGIVAIVLGCASMLRRVVTRTV